MLEGRGEARTQHPADVVDLEAAFDAIKTNNWKAYAPLIITSADIMLAQSPAANPTSYAYYPAGVPGYHFSNSGLQHFYSTSESD